jgi:hypothetical protein
MSIAGKYVTLVIAVANGAYMRNLKQSTGSLYAAGKFLATAYATQVEASRPENFTIHLAPCSPSITIIDRTKQFNHSSEIDAAQSIEASLTNITAREEVLPENQNLVCTEGVS